MYELIAFNEQTTRRQTQYGFTQEIRGLDEFARVERVFKTIQT